jgi:5-methylthioadenosine/S-adenosylhomocysteine deaminase
MRLTLDIARAQGLGEAELRARRMLELATIEGARALELENLTGSLTPGKRADVVLVRLDALNIAPAVDVPTALVHCARPDNVELVVADGRVLKRDGVLVGADADTIAPQAASRLEALCGRAGLVRARAAGQAT